MISSYYRENENNYIKGFANYMASEYVDEYGEEFTTNEIEELFKFYMLDYKNIKIDLRTSFWKEIMRKALQKHFEEQNRKKMIG